MTSFNSNRLGQSLTNRKTCAEFLRVLSTEVPIISELNFRTYLLAPGLDERLQSKELIEAPILAKIEQLRNDYGGSLWDATLKILMLEGKGVPRALLNEAAVHNHNARERSFTITNDEFVKHGIDMIIRGLADDEGLAISSRLRMRNGFNAHLPMLDFACKPSALNLEAVEYFLRAIDQSGVVLNSGNSYHFVGTSLLTTDEWLRFMGQSLLFTPLIDARYIGHRLYDGESYLRVFANNKLTKEPFIESFVHSTLS